jgi:enamine deaminase RidA (YjgF/YER057c/UK114 family)
LTIRVENIRQWNCTCLVGPLRKIASARKRSNFTLQFLEAHLRLRELHQRVLHIFGGSQGGLPILGKRFGVGPARLRDLGCDLSKIEKPPSQRSRPNRLKAARLAALNALAVARQHLGSLDTVTRIVRLGVSVATVGDVREHPKVADGASELLQDVFGRDKNPSRLVYGVASLPLGTPVELELIFEVSS